MIRYIIVLILALIVFSGCQEKHKETNLDGKKLIQQKCSQCHNLDLPPKTFDNEKAPPMMAVAFHIKDFIEAANESEKIPKAIEFVKDFVINPSIEKSYCDKKSLEQYGLMPSQKGNVTQDELQAIATYMFEHFNVKNLLEAQATKARLAKMSKGERLAIKYNCLGCHKKDKDLVGPSFAKISQRYKNNQKQIKQSIELGSKNKWKDTKVLMPGFKDKIKDEDISTLAKWIGSL
jgi:cytochrome c